ncbi:MAG: hypothetical protein ACM3X6_02065 [Patescibacteria group bacterium]
MHRRHLRTLLPLVLILAVCAGQALAADPAAPQGDFLIELATILPVDGFDPAVFKPENKPSRFEIAYFLFQFDKRLAVAAKASGYDLTATLARVWLAAHADAPAQAAGDWAARAALGYRRLLLAYNREMSALGFELRADANPPWAVRNADVPGR